MRTGQWNVFIFNLHFLISDPSFEKLKLGGAAVQYQDAFDAKTQQIRRKHRVIRCLNSSPQSTVELIDQLKNNNNKIS